MQKDVADVERLYSPEDVHMFRFILALTNMKSQRLDKRRTIRNTFTILFANYEIQSTENFFHSYCQNHKSSTRIYEIKGL